MTLADLFTTCNARGLRLANVVGELKLRGPDGAITSEILDSVREHKSLLLALLRPSPDGVDVAEANAITAEGRGEITPPETIRACEELDRLIHGRDWRDWRLEWLCELGHVFNLYRFANEVARQRLLLLAHHTPGSEREWLAIATTWRNAVAELRQQGKLPAFVWPAR